MAKKEVPLTWVVISFLIATLLGSGAVWQFMELRMKNVDRRLELRELTTAKLVVVAEMISKGLVCDRYGPGRITLPAHIADLNAYEGELAKIENREPRENLYGQLENTRPCPPSGFTVQ